MNDNQRMEWMLWRGLHFLAALSVPLLLITLMSCIKAKEEKADFGAEVSPTEIDAALSKAVNEADVSGTAVGQFLSYSVIRRLETEESTINLGGTHVSVFDKIETATDITFTLKIQQSQRLADNSFEVLQSEQPLRLLKGPIDIASLSNPPSTINTASLAGQRINALAKKPIKTTYHRLRQSDGSIDVPPLVKAKPDCGGLAPCELPVRFVQFDLVQWFSDESYQKVTLDFAFSLKTPYLPFGATGSFDRLTGVLVTDCRATVVPVEGRTVYVRDCMSLEDFQK